MAAAIADILSFLGLGEGGGPDPKSLVRADLGAHWNLAIALVVINTVIVVFYLWHIWRQEPPPIRRRPQSESGPERGA